MDNGWIQQSSMNLQNMYDTTKSGIQGAGKGDFYAMLGEILTKQLNGGISNLDDYKRSSGGAISRSFDQSRTNMKEDLASRGMGGSGAALAAMGQLAGQRANALGDNSLKLDSMNRDYQNNALSQLFNLNSLGVGVDQSKISNMLNLTGLMQGEHQFNRELDFQSDNKPSGFAQFLGQLLGAGAQIGSAYVTKG